MEEDGHQQPVQGIISNGDAGGRLCGAAGSFWRQCLNVRSLLPLTPFLSCCFFSSTEHSQVMHDCERLWPPKFLVKRRPDQGRRE